jgi:small-conductance mechanosensitive channel
MMELGLLTGGSEELVNQLNVGGIFPALLVALLSWFLSGLLSRFFDSLGERWISRRLLIKQVSVFLRFLLVIVTLFWMISLVFELSGQGISVLIGLVFFAFSFSSKDLVASLMSGIILLFDRPFQVGDRISFDGVYGEVLEIGLRSVRIVDLDDNLISIPNNQFLHSQVSSANAGNLDQLCVMTFFIGNQQDHHAAMKLVRESVASSRFVYCDKPITILLKDTVVGEYASKIMTRITAKAYVIDGRYESAFISDVNIRVKDAFRKAQISIE